MDNSGWTDLPQEVEACDTDRSVLVYAVTAAGPETFRLRATYEGTCALCRTASARDACMVGTWTMTGGGPLEWMRANGMPADFRVQQSDVTFRMSREGEFSVNPVRTDIRAEDEDVSNHPVGTACRIGLRSRKARA